MGATFSWLFVSSILTHYRKKFRLRAIFWFNKFAGGAIFIIGLATIFSLFITQ